MTTPRLESVEVRTQVVGFGPAALGAVVAADRRGRLAEMLELGIVFVERERDLAALRRRSLAFVITSNSRSADFVASLRRDGLFAPVWQREAAPWLLARGDALVPLLRVASLLGDIAERVQELCAATPASAVHWGRTVARIQKDGSGWFITEDEAGAEIARSRNLVLAMGAEENTAETRALVKPDLMVIPSDSVLRGDTSAVEEALRRRPRAPIVVLGGSHSGFSSAALLLDRFGSMLERGQLRVVHRGVALYAPPTREIISGCDDRARLIPAPGEEHRFRGLRGKASALFEAIRDGAEKRVDLRVHAAGDPLPLDDAGVVIQATGYQPRRIALFAADGSPIDPGWERRRLAVDAHGRVLDSQGAVIEGVFGIGAGSCPLWIDSELQVGVNLFHGVHGAAIADQILPTYRGGPPMATKQSFSKAIGSLPDASEGMEWTHQLKRGRVPGPRMEHNRLLADEAGVSTKAVHAGTYVDPTTGAVGTPVFQTTTFLFSEHTYASFAQGVTRDVPIYTRYGNPNQWTVQEKIACLEGSESALVFSSGMAAISTTLQALTNHGGHIITSYDVYGGTYNLMRDDMHQIGRSVSFVDGTDTQKVEAAIRDETQILFFETLTNPLLKPIDVDRMGELATRHNLLLVVDNTFLSPVFLRPIRHGAHIVIHSGTKYLNGHSDLTAGTAAGSRKYIDRVWAQMLRNGGSLEPMSCFLFERGLKTLGIRMRAHNENAAQLVRFLASHERIRRVHHPLAPGYPHRELLGACKDGYGGVLSFEVEGGDEAALRLLDKLTIPAAATSLGGVESLVSLPFNTSHSSLTATQRAAVGIEPGLVRFSVGIEDAQDLIDDLRRALQQL